MIPTRDRHQIKSHAQKFARCHPEMKLDLFRKHLEHQKRICGTKKVPVKYHAVIPKMEKAAPKRKPVLEIRPQMKPEKKGKLSIESTNHHPVKQEAGNIDAMESNPNFALRERTQIITPSVISNPYGTTRPSLPVGQSTTVAPADHRDIASNRESFFNVPILDHCSENHHLKSADNPLSTGPVIRQEYGAWSEAEHCLFETGCIKYGWGEWKAISLELTTRTRTQVKSHAQKFQRIRPLEKVRLDKEHLQFCRNREKLAKKQLHASRKAAKSGQAENRHCKNKKASEGSIIPKPSLESRRASGWTFVEEKQFEDGCIFWGWGNWRDIASHIITKSMPEVFAFAESYNRNDRQRLEREHRLHYQVDGTSTASDEMYVPTQIHHVLLGTGGEKSNANEGSFQNSTRSKTPFDDYGAATAILALRELGCK